MNDSPSSSFEAHDRPAVEGAVVERSSERSRPRRMAWRWGLVFGVIAFRLAGIQGWIVPVQIVGDSMVPTMLGEHQRVTCGDCEWRFTASASASPAPDELVCPNCGARGVDAATVCVEPGERVWIDRFAYAFKSIPRGDFVALCDPIDSDRLAVKRVVGLPGERIRVRDGDVWINGQRWRKSFDEFRAVAVLVHDDEHSPARGRDRLPARWREQDGWSVYHQWRCFASPLPRSAPSPVLDNDSFNQLESRRLCEVPDQMLVGQLTLAEPDSLVIRATLFDGALLVVFNGAEKKVEVRHAADASLPPEQSPRASLLMQQRLPAKCLGRPVSIAVAVCDGRVHVACDEKVVLVSDDKWSVDLRASGPTPWSVSVLGQTSTLTHRQVWRDLYYVARDERADAANLGHTLGADEYFLLGDNSPISIDSRDWPGHGVAKRQIVGRVLRKKWL